MKLEPIEKEEMESLQEASGLACAYAGAGFLVPLSSDVAEFMGCMLTDTILEKEIADLVCIYNEVDYAKPSD